MARLILGIWLACGCGLVWAQRPPVRLLEDSIETIAEQVHFPATMAGSLTVSGGRVLQLGPDTRFYAAGRQVSLREMAVFTSRAGTASVTIHYRLKDAVVSRVTMLTQ